MGTDKRGACLVNNKKTEKFIGWRRVMLGGRKETKVARSGGGGVSDFMKP